MRKIPRSFFTFYCFYFLFLFTHSAYAQADSTANSVKGFVDMHTHPRSDLAFGGELFYGAPYGDIAVALKNCKADHGKNFLRAKLAEQTETQYNAKWMDKKTGYPDFSSWPAWCSVLHQQMWVDWIERAHQGGLNIMVALATNSHCIAAAAKTHGAHDDEQAITDGIQGIKDLVAHSTFMEIALTPEDVRRITTAKKLAVILGVETDNIGNFYSPAEHSKGNFNPSPSEEEVQAELDKLWSMGVRYIFPIHITNNAFGGAAIYISEFDVANKFNTGAEFKPEDVSTKETGIAFHLQHPVSGLNSAAKMAMPFILPHSISPARKKNYTCWEIHPGFGHRNSLGLTDRGRFALEYMMKKGFIIDIDHMSEKAANEALDMASKNNYPVNSGHNFLRGKEGSEEGRTLKQYNEILHLGGMIGIGHGNNASDFVRTYHEMLRITRYQHVAIGTDAGGFYPLPKADERIQVVYDSLLTHCTSGNRSWDINIDGFAHYGLFPDYIRSWDLAGMTRKEKHSFMTSAEHFTQMWEKCELNKSAVKIIAR